MSSDEFDGYVDEYDGLDFDAIPDLNDLNPPAPVPEVQSSQPARPPSSTSSHYSFDNLDQSLLVELDEIESRLIEDATESTIDTGSSTGTLNRSANADLALPLPAAPAYHGHLTDASTNGTAPPWRSSSNQPARASTSSTSVPTDQQLSLSRIFGGPPDHPSTNDPPQFKEASRPKSPSRSKQPCHAEDFPSKVPSKRGQTESSITESPKNSKKGKGKSTSDSSKEFLHILEGLEDEMTCPICCDIFVAAHLGNPCGHSVCGECGEAWISKLVRIDVLSEAIPDMCDALAASGRAEWQSGGNSIKEWQTRKESWKQGVAKKNAEKAAVQVTKSSTRTRVQIHINHSEVASWMVPDDEADEDFELHEDLELIPPPARRVTRSRAVR
ncbi:hypothetical protein FIBSPDRAFT_882609 [Athelia psychrophila]|uniref:Zinc finger C3HC4 RING-type domain-containing protein n=1 Tax=Athelia psychrophila TaxID=1759441 RepID=A0A166V1A7_9AGAM|nr:hypothetical protein FIBSPDRAFT_882609 [Fibularhizoctonia sp. CBS 109695]